MKSFFPKAIKIVSILIVLCVPFFIFITVINSPAPKKQQIKNIEDYRLPERYTANDVFTLVDKMRSQDEFKFYFQAINKERLHSITQKAADVLVTNPNAKDLLDQINRLYEHVSAISFLFYHLDYSNEFISNPSIYPDLDRIYWEFLTEEFKLTILGFCYKSNYDQEFKFRWDGMSRLAAEKLYSIFMARSKFEFEEKRDF